MPEGNPAEHVLEEVRDADDLEAARRDVEQGLQRSPGAVAVGEDDQVRPLGLDDVGEVCDAAEDRQATVGLAPRLVVDDAEDSERDVPRVLGGFGDVLGPAARSDHEDRRFAANCRRQTASHRVERAKTEIAINARVETDSLVSERGIQKVSAETTTRPVKVPTLAGTAGPRMKGTALNALRNVKNQTAAASRGGEEDRRGRGKPIGGQRGRRVARS